MSEGQRERTTAVAAVVIVLVALFGLAVFEALRDDSTQPQATRPQPTGAGGALARQDWARVDYPLDCGGADTQVLGVELGDLTGDGVAEATVRVRCAAGAGSPPSALFVYGEGRPSPRPQLVATLVTADDDVLLTSVDVGPDGVRATGMTYSGKSVPRCCPDETFQASWTWTGTTFARTS